MNPEYTVRTAALIGEEGVEKLAKSRVLVCGLGGVGGYVVEALARAGVGTLGLLDFDTVAPSNINRQILATTQSIGRKKTEVASERVKSINPDCNVKTYDLMYLHESADKVDLGEYDYVVDAVDNVTAKLELITRAKAQNVAIVSSMGTGTKLNTCFEICDIKKTSVCPLAKVMRKELKDRGIEGVKVLYSKEIPQKSTANEKGRVPSSISYVPAVAGLMLAGEVIRDLAGVREI